MPLNASLAMRITAGSLAAISAASLSAAARSWSRGTTEWTEPNACSSAAVAGAGGYIMARARCCGTSRDRCVAAPSAPRSTSGRPNVASSLATMMSAFPARPIPPPRQNPCTAAITGTAHSYTAAKAAKQPRLAPISASNPPLAWISLISTPALKPRPSARSTTTRTSPSAPADVTASASSNQPATGSAFTGGWSTTTSAMPAASILVLITTPPSLRMLAADRDDLPGHVRGIAAGEEHDDVGDLPRLRRPAERLARRQFGEQFLARGLRQVRVHRDARRHGVHPDTERCRLDRRAPGERHDPRLRRGVVRLARLRAPADHRGVVDDGAAAARQHVPQRGPGAPERAVQRHVERAVPLLVAHLG